MMNEYCVKCRQPIDPYPQGRTICFPQPTGPYVFHDLGWPHIPRDLVCWRCSYDW